MGTIKMKVANGKMNYVNKDFFQIKYLKLPKSLSTIFQIFLIFNGMV